MRCSLVPHSSGICTMPLLRPLGRSVSHEKSFVRLPSGLLKEYMTILNAPISARDSAFHSQNGNKAL